MSDSAGVLHGLVSLPGSVPLPLLSVNRTSAFFQCQILPVVPLVLVPRAPLPCLELSRGVDLGWGHP
jgi:hypothetical protein